VHTRYDQLSVIRTVELLLGLDPLSLGDALAEPMYDAFVTGSTPDLRPYTAVQPALARCGQHRAHGRPRGRAALRTARPGPAGPVRRGAVAQRVRRRRDPAETWPGRLAG